MNKSSIDVNSEGISLNVEGKTYSKQDVINMLHEELENGLVSERSMIEKGIYVAGYVKALFDTGTVTPDTYLELIHTRLRVFLGEEEGKDEEC